MLCRVYALQDTTHNLASMINAVGASVLPVSPLFRYYKSEINACHYHEIHFRAAISCHRCCCCPYSSLIAPKVWHTLRTKPNPTRALPFPFPFPLAFNLGLVWFGFASFWFGLLVSFTLCYPLRALCLLDALGSALRARISSAQKVLPHGVNICDIIKRRSAWYDTARDWLSGRHREEEKEKVKVKEK